MYRTRNGGQCSRPMLCVHSGRPYPTKRRNTATPDFKSTAKSPGGGFAWNAKLDMNPTYLKDFSPHYYHDAARLRRHGGEFTIYGKKEDGLQYEYSDRLHEWDREKSARCWASAKEKFPFSPPPYNEPSVEMIQEYLSLYIGRPLKVAHIVSGVNGSNGYPYQVFGYREG